MAIDPTIETDIITAKVDSEFAQPVYESIPDGTLTTYTNGKVNPYIAMDYGTPAATFEGRSIVGEAKQPFNIRVILSAVAPTSNLARKLTSKGARVLTGFQPSVNAGPLRLVGGGGYTIQFDETKPTVYVSELYFVFIDNLDVED